MVKTLDSILRAVKDGKTADVARTLEHYPLLIVSKDERGASLLHWAVDRGNLELIDLLLSRGADTNAQNNEGVTALHWAVHYGEYAVIRNLLQHGANPNMATHQGQTPLHWAVLRDPLIILTEDDRPEIIKLLLAYGADRGVTASDSRTPLDVAVRRDDHNLQVETLLRENSNIAISGFPNTVS